MSMLRPGLILLLLAALCLPLEAQQFSGTLRGVVQDSTGAIVPGAEVSVVEVATNDAHVIVTGDSGTYVVPQLKPGNYRITVKKDGFKSPTFDEVKVDVGQIRAFDVTLEVGQTSEAVLRYHHQPVFTAEVRDRLARAADPSVSAVRRRQRVPRPRL